MAPSEFPLAFTFDDVILVPQHSEVLPRDCDTTARLAGSLTLRIPLISAAMDSITESKTAIVMAQAGGLGVIHRNLTAEEQALEVEKVKRAEAGMIVKPITMAPSQTVREALEVMRKATISGVPITEGERLVGILTHRDLRFVKDHSLPISRVMTEKVITAPEGITLERAKEVLQEHRIEKLPVVDGRGNLRGLITIKDLVKQMKFPHSSKDELGRLRVGAAVGIGEAGLERAELLIRAGVDLLVVDTAHGHSKAVLDAVSLLSRQNRAVAIVAGNVATAEATEALIRAGAQGIKVGVGPGSICTTRIVSGVGMPQLTAILECAKVALRHQVPVIADGGIKYSGDITKALAAGADSVMIGGLFAGADEAPGEIILYQGRSYKSYRGMGSLGAMRRGGRDRYFQEGLTEDEKLVPEGIEGMVPHRGPLVDIIHQLIGGLKSGMGYVGAPSLPELRKRARFMQVTRAGLKEGHVHDVVITKEAPNYRLE